MAIPAVGPGPHADLTGPPDLMGHQLTRGRARGEQGSEHPRQPVSAMPPPPSRVPATGLDEGTGADGGAARARKAGSRNGTKVARPQPQAAQGIAWLPGGRFPAGFPATVYNLE